MNTTASRPTTRIKELSQTERRYVSNAILHALRRRPNTITRGVTKSFEVYGANTIHSGPKPIPYVTRWLGRAGAHAGLGLPEIGVEIIDTTYKESVTECAARDWHDLYRVTYHTRIQTLFVVSQHPRTGWYAQRNPRTGRAGEAALVFLRKAMEASGVTTSPNGDEYV